MEKKIIPIKVAIKLSKVTVSKVANDLEMNRSYLYTLMDKYDRGEEIDPNVKIHFDKLVNKVKEKADTESYLMTDADDSREELILKHKMDCLKKEAQSILDTFCEKTGFKIKGGRVIGKRRFGTPERPPGRMPEAFKDYDMWEISNNSELFESVLGEDADRFYTLWNKYLWLGKRLMMCITRDSVKDYVNAWEYHKKPLVPEILRDHLDATHAGRDVDADIYHFCLVNGNVCEFTITDINDDRYDFTGGIIDDVPLRVVISCITSEGLVRYRVLRFEQKGSSYVARCEDLVPGYRYFYTIGVGDDPYSGYVWGIQHPLK